MAKGKKIHIDFDQLARGALEAIGDVSVEQAKGNMNKVSYGRVYMVGGRAHIASKEGDSPNNMSGALNETIRYEIHGREMEFGAGNGTVDYAKYLEGYLNRPNITKSIIERQTDIERIVGDLFVKSMRMA